ncbi:GNAT family N-acetyltransferase [Natronocalculus amylovorans]|uniref:GNAT family N-acetyltransferase n=1 Tax=Natronocalculus amylovorans TaxID=2917812 RepID=A0AAE3K991_9EURY|nr:GNAT family N-acetyltransferase [Natronocalculus amylovorans]MCL9818112.1 GNAT family N-acetyltransferase [Natronocalculus amylovorans]
MRIERVSLDEWGELLPTRRTEVFHSADALGVLERYSDTELRPYVCFNGQQPVGFLPAFIRENRLGSITTSPPPGLNVPRLGPIVVTNSPKRRKRESISQSVAAAIIDELQLDRRNRLARIECGDGFSDPRPYVWNGFDVDVSFTYYLDVAETTPDALLKQASKSLRREITDARDEPLTFDVGGMDAARQIYDATVERYAAQDRSYPIEWAYVRDLLSALGDNARSYVVTDPGGAFLTGINVLYSNDTAYFWQGGTRSIYEGVAVNSALHWHILEDIAADESLESVHRYDLMGANTKRLCRYKSKFPVELQPHYVIESNSPAMRLAKKGYKALK